MKTTTNGNYSLSYFDPAHWWADGKPEPKWVYDNKVKQTDLDWSSVSELLSTHLTVEVKQQTPLFNGARWKSLDDPSSDLVEYHGVQYIRKSEVNMVETTLLILDYDDGTSMDDVIDDLQEWTHCGYTSHSHNNTRDKFRVVIPLLTPIPAYLLNPKGSQSILPALGELFNNIDETSFDRSRAFFFPSCPQSTKHLAFTWNVSGRLFDWTILKVTERVLPIREYDDVSADIVGLFKQSGLYLNKGSGHRHDALCPWRDNHTHDVDTGFSIWDGQGFKCLHSHCKTKTYQDLVAYFVDSVGEETAAQFGLMSKDKYITKKNLESGKITKKTIHEIIMGRA